MNYAYSNNGLSFRSVGSGYVAASDEVLFNDIATPAELTAAFPAYASATAAVELAAQAAAALAAGLTIISTGTPALNAAYAVDRLSQMDIIAIETSINAGKGFPNGAAQMDYPDAAGMLHAFTEANFTDFASAVRDFVYGCRSVIAGQSAQVPASSVTIP